MSLALNVKFAIIIFKISYKSSLYIIHNSIKLSMKKHLELPIIFLKMLMQRVCNEENIASLNIYYGLEWSEILASLKNIKLY